MQARPTQGIFKQKDAAVAVRKIFQTKEITRFIDIQISSHTFHYPRSPTEWEDLVFMSSEIRAQLAEKLTQILQKNEPPNSSRKIEIGYNPQKLLIGQKALSRPSGRYALYLVEVQELD